MKQNWLPSTSESILLIIEFITGITGGVWLLISGEWLLVIGGALAALFIQHVFALVTLPASILEPRFAKAVAEQRKLEAAIIGFGIGFYLNIIHMLWVVAVFVAFIIRHDTVPVAPLIFCAYAVAMSPLTYYLTEEPEVSIGTRRGIAFTQVEFLVLVILYLIGVSPLVQLQVVIAVVTLFSIVNTTLGVLAIRKAGNSGLELRNDN